MCGVCVCVCGVWCVCVCANFIQFVVYTFYRSATVCVTLCITGEEFQARTDVPDVSSAVM